jgi:hypothetical protein
MSSNKPMLTISILAKTHMCSLTHACMMKVLTDPILLNKVSITENLVLNKSDLPKGRSMALTTWYESAKENDLFMFIDADQMFTPNDIIKSMNLIEQKVGSVVCGSYPKKDDLLVNEPKDSENYYKNKEGELYYGATGFMMMNYDIVKRLVKHLGEKVLLSNCEFGYTFFYHRIVKDQIYGYDNLDLWLGEDYSFCWLVRQLGDKVYGYISPTIGHIIPDEKFPDETKYIPKHISHYKDEKIWDKNTVVIFCGNTAEQWSGKNLETGIGGSETAVIQLSKYWTKQGYNVTVYCNCDNIGMYNGVNYLYYKDFNVAQKFDILIVWRCIDFLDIACINNARKCFLDLHDVVKPETITPRVLSNVNKICVKSSFHASMLGFIPMNKVAIIPNGGAVKYEDDEIKKDPNYIIYSSSYDRGLAYMLKWGWPVIKKSCPNAYLKIFYGWNTFDKIQPDTPDVKLYKDTIVNLMKQDGVQECGRISNEELMKEKKKASIHYYVGNFQEIDCISVRESASVGTIPVVAEDAHVFKEKSYCVKISGNPIKCNTQTNAGEKIVELLQNPDTSDKLRHEFVEKVKEETWENIAQKWIELFQ